MPMKPGMRMMMMKRVTQDESRNRSEYGGSQERRMIGYDRDYGSENRRMNYGMDETEARRRRDSRGRFMEGDGWEGNRGYPRSEYDEHRYGMGRGSPNVGGDDPEARRRRDSRGRYALNLMDDDDEPEMRSQTWFPPMGNIPPMGNMYPTGMHPGNSYGDIYAHGSIYAPGAMNKPMGMQGDMNQPVDERTARMWVQDMKQPAGGKPMPAFKLEESETLRKAHCPQCDMWEFFVALNMRYSDEFKVAKQFGVDRPDYYAALAKSFLEDDDAGPNKLRKYMSIIPK